MDNKQGIQVPAGTPTTYRAVVDPSTKPLKVGDMHINTETGVGFLATGTESVQDWKQMTNA